MKVVTDAGSDRNADKNKSSANLFFVAKFLPEPEWSLQWVSVAVGTQGGLHWDAQFDCEEGCDQEPLPDRGDHHSDKYVHFDILELRYWPDQQHFLWLTVFQTPA